MLPQSGILGMFARSPIRPIQQHMQKALACAELLLPFIDATVAQDWDKAVEIRRQITALEREADSLKMDFRLHLPKGLFLPVPRGDLLQLISQQDLIANIAKDISGIMLGRKMQIPKPLAEQFIEYLQRSIDAAMQANKAINELDELLESGFRGKEVTLVENMVQELNKIEYDTDKIQIKIREQLFNIEKELQPIDVMFLYKIIEWVGLLADTAQNVGNRLQVLSAT